MNTSLSWIKAYVPDLNVTAQEYTDAMTLSGTKVEGYEKLDADLDKIVGLSTGADDYLIKPFNPLELTARVKAQLRRYTTFNPGGDSKKELSEIVLNNLTINKENHVVVSYGREVKLTPIEFDILYLLASNPGRVFATDEIFERVWNEKMYEANNTVMVHIRRLREKIEEDSRNAQIIKTVWGVGYKIEK